MLKHVQATPRCRSSLARSAQKADALSISSTLSYISQHETTLSSRSSSCTSLNESHSSSGSGSVSVPPAPPPITVRLYTHHLRADLEYKTMRVKHTTSCRDLINQLLVRYRLRHRDPNLFYITMEVATRGSDAAVRTVLVLDDDSRPAQLQACYPRVDARFTIRVKQGYQVNIFDSVVMPMSQCTSLQISQRTTAEQLIQLLLNTYNSAEKASVFSLYEVCRAPNYERKLHAEDCPLVTRRDWPVPDDYSLVLRKRLTPTARVGRQFPGRRPFVRWSKSRESVRLSTKDRAADERRPRSQQAPPLPLLNGMGSDDEDVFLI